MSDYLTSVLSNTLFELDGTPSSSSASLARISIVSLVLLGPVKDSSVYFSWNISLMAFSYSSKRCFLASVHVYIYVTQCTGVLETGIPLAVSIQLLINDPTLCDGPRNRPIWVSPRPVSSLNLSTREHRRFCHRFSLSCTCVVMSTRHPSVVFSA